MAYDFADVNDRSPPKLDIEPADPRDLEALVTCLELAAIILTTESGKVLTKEALFAEAQATAGPECPISDHDLGIILPFAKFLKRAPGGYVLK